MQFVAQRVGFAMSVYPRVRTAGQAWFVLLFFIYFFWKHWGDPFIRGFAYFYGVSMIVALVWLVVQARRDRKEMERQLATGELLEYKPRPKI